MTVDYHRAGEAHWPFEVVQIFRSAAGDALESRSTPPVRNEIAAVVEPVCIFRNFRRIRALRYGPFAFLGA
jgi:hypothetical protein